MTSRMTHWTTFVMLGAGLAGTLCAQQGITPGEALRLRQQCAREIRVLQDQMAAERRESQHVVMETAVAEREAREEQDAKQSTKRGVQKANVNPHSPQQKAEVDEALKAFNARLPEINASLAQASSNSTFPKMVLNPMTADALLAASGSGSTAEQQAVKQMIHQRIQEELKKADPETRNQMKAVLKAMEQGKTISVPPNMPSPRSTQLLPKGSS